MSSSKKSSRSLAKNSDPTVHNGEVIDLVHFTNIPPSFFDHVTMAQHKVEKLLYASPSLLKAVKAAVPEEMLTAVLTDDQKQKLAKGALKLVTKKDGSFMATLVNPSTGRFVANVPLETVKISPSLSQAMTDLSTQLQMAQIAEQIQCVQQAVERVSRGQENDRLATAFSCQQKFLQISSFQNPELKNSALLQLAMDAEDSRNLLMQSQKENIKFIQGQPKAFWEKLLTGSPPKEIKQSMNEIRDSLYAINAVSLVEVMAYQEIGEPTAAIQSLEYYGTHIQVAFLSQPDFVERLDQLDSSPDCYWSKDIPKIQQQISRLSPPKGNSQRKLEDSK